MSEKPKFVPNDPNMAARNSEALRVMLETVWKKSSPTEPGFYWFRYDETDSRPEPVEVSRNIGPNPFTVRTLGIDVYHDLAAMDGEWQPVEPPRE